MNQDEEHLRLLSIFHYVVAGIAGLMACVPFFHVAVGVTILVGEDDFPKFMGVFFIVIAALMIILGATYAICMFVAAHRLAARSGYTFCLVMAALSCMFFPFGTALGVFTIIVLSRPSVRELFGRPVA